MKYKILIVFVVCAFAVTPTFAVEGQEDELITVNCANGQSLNQTLSRVHKLKPATVIVKGTCTEYVVINGFNGLTLKGAPGAALQQPATTPTNGLGPWVLLISASRSITVDGLPLHSAAPALAG